MSSSQSYKQTRAKTGANPSLKEKWCIIRDEIKYQNDTRKFRKVCEKSAKNLRKVCCKSIFKAVNFSKDIVYARCILCEGVGDMYEADVIYQNNYLNRYIKN